MAPQGVSIMTQPAGMDLRLRLRAVVALLVACCLFATTVRAAGDDEPLVLTGIQATYSIATALTRGTAIQVRNVPPDGRELALQRDYIERRMARLAPEFAAATAVVTTTNALPQDPLYRFAREANIRIVDIDAAIPWSPDRAGVALAGAPASTVAWGADPDAVPPGTAPYFWLGIANAIRMADLTAADLAELFPESAERIGANLEDFKRSLLRLRADYQAQLIEFGDDALFALTGDFIYLTNDLALPVDGYFIKQDVRWTEADLAGLTRHLRDNRIRVVLHRWMPSEAIQQAVRTGGARLVVLEAGDPGLLADGVLAPDGLQRILRDNLDAIVSALREP